MKTKIASQQQEELPVYSSDDFEDVSSKSRQQTAFPIRADSRLGKTDSSFSSSYEISRMDGVPVIRGAQKPSGGTSLNKKSLPAHTSSLTAAMECLWRTQASAKCRTV